LTATIIGAQREEGMPSPTFDKLIMEYTETEEDMNYWSLTNINSKT
jgi:hypothetical protein